MVMEWRKLSTASTVLIYIAAIIIVCGSLPLLLIHRHDPDTENLSELSKQVLDLEKKQIMYDSLISNFHRDRAKSLVTSNSTRLERLPDLSDTMPTSTARIVESEAGHVKSIMNASVHEISMESAENFDPAKRTEEPDFSRPITFNTPTSHSASSVLVVGGTDGSGTRRVVQILSQLGVTMVSEDPETYDIHADLVGGWPRIVEPVLEHTESISYDPEKFPEILRTRMTCEIRKLLDLVDSDSRKSESHILAVGGSLPKPSNITAKSVKYGFKAPVAMTLAPYWEYILTDFKMLHVLRDGRDIAYSANQGPVEKFYRAMYKNNAIFMSDRDEVKAIRLWSDWNAGLKKWAEDKVNSYTTQHQSNEKSFGYYAIHSEDLVDGRKEVRYNAIANLADWLGSDISDDDLCCIAVRGSEFMGSHDRTPKGPGIDTVSSRYGKWKKRMLVDPNLSESIITAGALGLKEFGYEPLRDFTLENVPEDSSSNLKRINRPYCTLQPKDCPSQEAPKPDKILNPERWAVPAVCTVYSGIDYKGGDLSSSSIPVLDNTYCCRLCKDTPRCKYFTVDTAALMCYLKSEKNQIESTDHTVNLISGDML